MSIQIFENSQKKLWDDFIAQSSINGNFLQSRRFLSYHPEDRFSDCSLFYFDPKGNLRAVIPGAAKQEENGLVFVSHPGSTYGGIVLDEKTCSAKRFQALLDELLPFLSENGFAGADLRFPPDFMWKNNEAPLIEYMLRLNGFEERIELTTFIDFSSYNENIVSNFSQGKRTNINNGKKRGWRVAPIDTIDSVERFHAMLTDNLKKHNAAPVHSVEELWDLYSNRLAGETEFFGVYADNRLIAAGWVFFFEEMRVAHTQYLCADESLANLSPMSFLYYSVIERCKEKSCRALSWGISTEDSGKTLNLGLTESKEHFGSCHGVHRSYRMIF